MGSQQRNRAGTGPNLLKELNIKDSFAGGKKQLTVRLVQQLQNFFYFAVDHLSLNEIVQLKCLEQDLSPQPGIIDLVNLVR